MWNVKKWRKAVGLMVAGLFLISLLSPINGHADTMNDVMSSSMYQPSYGGSVGPGGGVTTYPPLLSITANNTDNGRLTTKTTQITVKFDGSVIFGSNVSTSSNRFVHFSFDVFTAGQTKFDPGISLATNTLTDYGNNKSSISFGSGKEQTFNVDLSRLGEDFPIYLGFRFTTQDGEVTTYQMGSLNENTALGSAMTPTITGTLKTSDTTITGTGTNVGDAIFTKINGVTTRTTVGADKTYKLDLPTSLASALTEKNNKVTVYESNNLGDKGSVDGIITSKSLNLTSTATTADSYLDDLATFSSDSKVIDWLANKAGLGATYSDGSATDTAGITYASDTADLATALKALADNETLSIPVYAQDSSGMKSTPITITVTNHAGILQFGTISSAIGFGNLEIPTTETIFQPAAAWNVNVSDTRAAGSNWSVYATATPLTSTTVSSRTLAGNLVYKDGNNKTVLTNASTLITSGTKVAGKNETSITSDWSATKGIMLDVKPSVYADSYQGSVDWSLQDTPAN